MTAAVLSATDASIARAVAALRAGDLVAFPTETVYGLGADASNPAAVRRLFEAKGRPADHPVIVHLAAADALAAWASDVPPEAVALAEAFWPGPMTLVLRRNPHVHDVVTGGQATVGVRVPAHPVAQRLLAAFGGGVAAPSANRFGHISPTSAAHVAAEVGDRAAIILDGGPCDVGIESTIIDVSSGEPRILRPGMITAAQIEAVVHQPVGEGGRAAPRVSGSLDSHYAPRTPAHRMALEALVAAVQPEDAVLALGDPPAGAVARCWIRAPSDPAAYARTLYANLRQLDMSGAGRILIEAVPDGPAWAGIRDRLARATHG